ncbi:MAG: ABC transporter ATP-binding protein [Clostridiales Family XIII bacterium]|nr:ABC transporter ATP-binding protein [Clostridiales Family XIII bacterium]
MKLELVRLDVGYDACPVLEGIDLSVQTGEILCILGPNGVGKTTLFKTILHLLRPLAGEVRIDGEDTAPWGARRRARHLAYVSQSHVPPFPYLAYDVVLLGRVNSIGYFGQPKARDYAAAEQAMEDMGVSELRGKPYTDISGGERQLVMIARALAQEPRMLVLDEPTAGLDYGNMLRVMKKVAALREKGYAVVMTTHSPDHAFLTEAKVALLRKGCPVLFGEAAEVITQKNLKDAYGADIDVVEFMGEGGRRVRVCAPRL